MSAIDVEPESPRPFEIGAYSGGFVSNYFHQFYDAEQFPHRQPRPELHNGQPAVGSALRVLRLAVARRRSRAQLDRSPKPDSGCRHGNGADLQRPAPADVSVRRTRRTSCRSSRSATASITCRRIYSRQRHRLSAFTSAPARASSFTARSRCASMAASCAGPRPQAPYTLDANLGEFMFGISFRPSTAARSHRRRRRHRCTTPTATACSTTSTSARTKPKTRSVRRQRRLSRSRQRRRRHRRRAGQVPARRRGQGRLPRRRRLSRQGQRRRRRRRPPGQVPDRSRGQGRLQGRSTAAPSPTTTATASSTRRTSARTKPKSSTALDDDDGCPDRGNALVVVSPDRLELLESIQFKKHDDPEARASTCSARSARRCARIPRSCACASPSTFSRRRIRTRTGSSHEQRAAALRDWLVKYGIDDKRLEPRGFGGTKPLVDRQSRRARKRSTSASSSSSPRRSDRPKHNHID